MNDSNSALAVKSPSAGECHKLHWWVYTASGKGLVQAGTRASAAMTLA